MGVHVTPSYPMPEADSKRVREINNEARLIQDRADARSERSQRAWWKEVEEEFSFTADHLKLLRFMEFRLHEDTDWVSIGADGKRPFGNGDWVKDIFTILGWKATYDEEGIDEASVNRACRIMAELPLALNALIAGKMPE